MYKEMWKKKRSGKLENLYSNSLKLTPIYRRTTAMSIRERLCRIDTSFEIQIFESNCHYVDMGTRACRHPKAFFDDLIFFENNLYLILKTI